VLVRVDLSVIHISERLMMTFSGGITSILEARPDVRIMILRPTLRSTPGSFKGDLVLIQVFPTVLLNA
jgi:hypothetical protein